MRRLLVKYHWYFVALFFAHLALSMTACGALTWLTDAKNILPVVANMVALILEAIAAFGGGSIIPADVAALIASVISKVLAGIKDIENAVAEYEATTPPPVGKLQEIEAITQAVIDNIDSFLNDTLPSIVNQAARDRIKLLVTLVLNEVKSLASLFPALEAKAGDKLTILVPMSTRAAKDEFNALLTAPTGDPAVDKALATIPKL